MVMKTPTFHGDEPDIEKGHDPRAALEAAVANALATSGGLNAWDVKVRVIGADIVLDGSVATTDEVERATAVAKSVAGVEAVRNQIVIGQSGEG